MRPIKIELMRCIFFFGIPVVKKENKLFRAFDIYTVILCFQLFLSLCIWFISYYIFSKILKTGEISLFVLDDITFSLFYSFLPLFFCHLHLSKSLNLSFKTSEWKVLKCYTSSFGFAVEEFSEKHKMKDNPLPSSVSEDCVLIYMESHTLWKFLKNFLTENKIADNTTKPITFYSLVLYCSPTFFDMKRFVRTFRNANAAFLNRKDLHYFLLT